MKSTLVALAGSLLVLQNGCVDPIGAEKAPPHAVYRQVQGSAVDAGRASLPTQLVLQRYNLTESLAKAPDQALQRIHQKALETRERSLLFALSELSYLAAERLRHNVKPWETRDPRDYYLASAVYAWFFLFSDCADPPPGPFDNRFHAACDLYNFGLGWALTEKRATNFVALLDGGTRQLPVGEVQIKFVPTTFPWSAEQFDRFVLADRFLVRGLSVRNGQSGLGTPLAAITKPMEKSQLSRAIPATVLLRPEGGLKELAEGRCHASLEMYSSYDEVAIQVGGSRVPLKTDTTMPMAYSLNQALLWKLGRLQFMSSVERVPSDVYLMQPYRTGKIPVVFVHGTFSSPIWWSEMINTLASDAELRDRCQFWYFVYNSGNPLVYSADKLRESLAAKIKELDPGGTDDALKQTVLIGHSQGGLLTKLAVTDTGEEILKMLLQTNRVEDLDLTESQKTFLRRYTCFKPLPFIKRVVFISTPHRGAYLAGNFARKLARFAVSLPSKFLKEAKQLTGLAERLKLPKELRGVPTSLDGMSTRNPILLRLAEMPIAPDVKGHSIIAVQGNGDYHKGKDGLVAYPSAHVDYVESEFIVRSFHSCQDKPATIEEVRRILHEHIASLPNTSTNTPVAPQPK